MTAKKGRSGAVSIMVVAILCAIWLGGYFSFHRMYSKVEMEFTAGALGDGVGISSDLDERVKLSYEMVTIAEQYMPANDSTIAAVLAARDALINAMTIRDKFTANVHLTDTTTALYQVLGTKSLSAADARYRTDIYNDLYSRNDTISHDPYNQEALAYNQTLTVFPANLLRLITFAQTAPLFE